MRRALTSLFVFLIAIAVANTALAQRKPKTEEDDRYKPRPVKLKTKDGVTLRAFYFPSEKGKNAITVLFVHEWQGQSSPYVPLIAALRSAGCAVLVPDYRGHGGSMEYIDVTGKPQKFDVSRMSKVDVQNIIRIDLEKAKGFLKEENNAENLNLNALVVVGVREGCILASHWASIDWSFPSVGSIKQSQDVKALVLISPEKQLKGLPIEPPLRDPNILQLPIMIVAGQTSPEAKDAERIGRRIEGAKKRAGGGTVSGFESLMIDTSLTGPSLVSNEPKVIPAIVDFITKSVPINDEENPWIER
ncbi:alpha/beta hydrolase [Rubripirellula amarantea]|uniref:alpha/beta hydrolase n=1 Tax=Rubripirellula amarantea TaxID=2527999 RepID=UPI001F5F3FAB|nr:alpha/beta fold hydrolase [Rubripirellula amarantea]